MQTRGNPQLIIGTNSMVYSHIPHHSSTLELEATLLLRWLSAFLTHRIDWSQISTAQFV